MFSLNTRHECSRETTWQEVTGGKINSSVAATLKRSRDTTFWPSKASSRLIIHFVAFTTHGKASLKRLWPPTTCAAISFLLLASFPSAMTQILGLRSRSAVLSLQRRPHLTVSMWRRTELDCLRRYTVWPYPFSQPLSVPIEGPPFVLVSVHGGPTIETPYLWVINVTSVTATSLFRHETYFTSW